MKFAVIRLLVLGFIALTLSCQNTKKEEKEQIKIGAKKGKQSETFELGETLFTGKGNCFSCHQINKTSIGPSVVDMVKIYQEQNADMIAFLKQEAEPIVDPENYAVMKTNFAVLKTFSDEELQALVSYMEEVSKK